MPGKPRVRSSAADWTGQTLFGKWTVERLIGVGGTATVLEARHRNGRRAALKVLHRHLAAQGRTRERFLREGRLANLVNHPGVVAVLDDFMTDDGTAVLVLELVRGKTLASLAKESGGVLSEQAVVSAAIEVLDILAVAHEANVVHRDVKPENVLLCDKGTVKLADFGLAGLCHELGTLTGTNQALGTPAYMSPEQARGDALQVDARTDIWGLGATMFALLTGRYVHAGSPRKNLVVAAATEPSPPILSVAPNIHPALASVVDRAVQMDREKRWPNARAMLAELRALDVPSSGERPLTSASLDGVPTMSTTSASHMSWSHAKDWLKRSEPARRSRAGVFVALTIAALVVLVAWQRSTPDRAAGDHTAATSNRDVVAHPTPSVAIVPPTTSAVSMKLPGKANVTSLAEGSVTAKRPLTARAPTGKRQTPSMAMTAATPVPPPPPAAALSIPDDVLDRRD